MKIVHNELSAAIREAYKAGEEDETLRPLVLAGPDGRAIGRIHREDGVIFYNIRGEREIELTRSLTEKGFAAFPVEESLGLRYATMIEYDEALNVAVAFPPDGVIRDTLSEVLSKHGIRQVKITEAEKAVHVGFFLNGKRGEPFPGEEKIIVPTRKDVTLFDEAPQMSIEEITETVIGKIGDNYCRFVFANFPNVDVVGHIENEAAILTAVEAVDNATGRAVKAALAEGMTVIVSADHGTVEKWLYPDGAVDTGHTDSPVPFILINAGRNVSLLSGGSLTDVAPTILHLMGIAKPSLMTGTSLIESGLFEATPSRRILFLVLDGWGANPDPHGNLIAKARTPVLDGLLASHPHTLLQASGEAVGLPSGTVGNSEAGHLHIGAGRLIYSDRVKIDRAIADGSFYMNPAFQSVMAWAKKRSSALHLMGIVSFFSSHGSLHHLFALLEMARREGVPEVYIHAMLGRRGELPESGPRYIEEVESTCENLGVGRVVSVIGRYWSMDREENWDRIEKTYRMLLYGEGTPVAMRREA
ncbi:MAG: 2,3-bisphosphoglycerate-independent phosphoglycerate mutase [Syntrophus sp. SKADARSKE-3]|nr:2,3-bisphosphoglycerate-independent phosphoglycerate mutase [Syntrophus sp. SKADARSKE-3]